MSGTKRRGRPRKDKVRVFKDGPAPSGRGISTLGEAVRAGQREFFKEMRREFGAGPYHTNDMISEVLKYSDGHLIDEVERIAAEAVISNARSRARERSVSGGQKRSRLNAAAKSEIISEHRELFEKVRNGKLTANNAAIRLQGSLLENLHTEDREPHHEREDWVPSVRELNMWFAEYRRK